MIRLGVLSLIVAGLVVYAWKDWFRSLCGLIVLMGVLEHPDMPRSILGVQGLNPWNLLMVGIVVAWLAQFRQKRMPLDLPRPIGPLLGVYILVILVGVARAMAHEGPYRVPMSHLIVNDLINTLKWVLPAVLLFHGCRTRKQLAWASLSILAMYALLSVQVIRAVRPEALIDADYLGDVRQKIDHRIGLHASDLSTILGGATWGFLAVLSAMRTRWQKLLMAGGSALCIYGQALTGGRAGFLAFGVTGLVMCALRWRKALLLAPILPLVVAAAFPAALDRFTEGFGETSVTGQQFTDDMAITSGRTAYWPLVIKKIGERPLLGYGTEGFWRTGLAAYVADQFNDPVGWPHSAYLEWLMDHGLVGFLPVMAFYGIAVFWSARLFHRGPDPWLRAAGGLALSAILAQLVAGIGSQHFYPLEGNVAMWASMFLMFRAHVAARHVPAGQVVAARAHVGRRRRRGGPARLAGPARA